jgi:DNA-directed RNA polymerase subunit RPC12/RpoP
VHEGVEVDEVITCVECGGRAHLLSHPQPDVGFAPGDAVIYRCSDCLDRFDVILPDVDDEP